MRRFSRLHDELAHATEAETKVAMLVAYLKDVPADDAAWAVFLLTGRRLKRLISGKELTNWALKASGLPAWLFAECQNAVGDDAETASLLLDRDLAGIADISVPLHAWIEDRIERLRELPADEREILVRSWWQAMTRSEIFLLSKLLTGSFRAGVPCPLVVQALAAFTGLPRTTISHRLAGDWTPSAAWFESLSDKLRAADHRAKPYPFSPASFLEQRPESLGPCHAWQAEWKWEGIRGQLIKRDHEIFLWAGGGELVTGCYPELSAMTESSLPDGTVIVGEILAWNEDGVMPLAALQKRAGRSKVSKRILDEAPVRMLAYDLLEVGGIDLRRQPLSERWRQLEALVERARGPLMLSVTIDAGSWNDLAAIRSQSRQRKAVGLMLRQKASTHGIARQQGDCWIWKADPLYLKAVLIYAQTGSGHHAGLFTDYTFGVWRGEELVPIAKTSAGLSEEEVTVLDRWIRQNTKERFGPVRHVEPHHVFELAFDAIVVSPRRKSGVSLQLPRIIRWLTETAPAGADTLEQVKALDPLI